MQPHSLLAKLYFILIHADGVVDEKEIKLGRQMIRYEKLDEQLFDLELEQLKGVNTETIYKESVQGLLLLSDEMKIRYIAWLSLIANADGFMDKREWQLIYRLYHTDLHLSLPDIMNKQRELNEQLRKPGGIAAAI